MAIYAMYDKNTGFIKRTLHISNDGLSLNTKDDEYSIEIFNGESDSDFYVSERKLVPYTPEELQTKNNLPPGFKWQMPERIAVDTRALADAQTYAWTKIKAARETAIKQPFTYNGNTYDTNIQNINNAVLSNITSNTKQLTWTTATNTVVTLNSMEINELGNSLHAHVNAAHDKARELRSKIYASDATIAKVDAINW